MAGRSTARGLFLLSVLVLVLVSLRPVAQVEAVLDYALMPVRVLSELARPLGWVTVPSVRAADRGLSALAEEDYDRRRLLFEEGSRFAVPTRADLRAGRRFVHAEVVDRAAGNEDRIVIALRGQSTEGLALEMPVASGDVFVGRITALDEPRPGHATVDLVTGRDFFVGAELVPSVVASSRPTFEPLKLVVGGVTRGEGADYGLAVHNPSRRPLPAGQVRVAEDFSVAGPMTRLAGGFELGRFVPQVERDGHVEPLIDYRSGLFQVVVVCPSAVERHTELPSIEELDDGRWRRVSATSSGDPSHWREGLKLGAGAWNGVNAGAAVVSGSRLVGRVVRASPLSADMALLGDPGLWIPAIARIEGREQPLVLGRLVSLGRDPHDPRALRFHWDAVLEWSGAEPAQAELFTGSGEPLVPRGLLLGAARVPNGPGPHELIVRQPVNSSAVRRLWVRTAAPDTVGEAP
jgi:hypothetical protein